MRVVVTGGAGYLGNHLVPKLVEHGHEVRVFDRLCFGEAAARRFQDLPGCELIRGDIRNLNAVPTLLDNADAIIYLAGLSNDPSCDLDPEMALEVNLHATERLIDLAIKKGVRRFVFASSCSVYGKGVFEILDEQSPTNPVSVYAQSKLSCEQVLLDRASKNFEPVIARPATLFGWSPRMRFDLAINLMVASAMRRKCITVFGSGKQWRPFIHVRDAARALTLMLEAPAETVAGEIFNVGSDTINYQIIDLARLIQRMFSDVELDVAKDDEDLRSYHVQFGKIKKVLDFDFEWSPERGAEEVREHLLDESVDPFDTIHFNVRRMKELLATPVAEGGEPVAARFVPLAPPAVGEEEERAVIEVMRSGWLTTGAVVTDFETKFAEKLGAPHAVAVSSCTAALHLCLVQAGVGPGDEIITSPLTWISTANTIVNMGARLVLADVRPDTLNIDPEAVEAAITDRTKAIIPVHLAGQPCDLDALHAIGVKHGIPIIEDAAHALGAAYKGVPIGAGHAPACFSFYPVKNITAIEGGMITVRDEAQAHRLRVLAHNGVSTHAWNRYSGEAPPATPEAVMPGFKYNMTNVSAAVGIEQLKKLDTFLAARSRLARMYRTVLAPIEEIELPTVIPDVQHAWHLFIIKLKLDKLKMTRDEIGQAMRLENVGTGVHFIALHRHRYYRDLLGIPEGALSHATAASDAILSLPLHPRLTEKNLQEVVNALKKVLAYAMK